MYASDPPTCTTEIDGGDVTAAEASLVSAAPTVTVEGTGLDAYTVTVASDSGQVATFDSATGETNIGPAPTT